MKVLVIGLAVSGRAAVTLLRDQGHEVVGFDERADAGTGLSDIEIATGGWTDTLLADIDLVVPSPGVPETAAPLRSALDAGIPVWSELELGYRARRDTPMFAVTGTNGKTTVTELATSMLVSSGVDAIAVGNIGDPISTAGPAAALVIEASSFQLRFIDEFRPTAAAVVNFAPDHLDWHADVAAYGAAKARIFGRLGPDDALVFDADDPGAVGLVANSTARRVGVSGVGMPGPSGRDGDVMVLAGVRIPIAELQHHHPALLADLAIAAEGAAVLGATPEGIGAAARSYQPGRHRREIVASADGITFIDDSKATNPHAALSAIGAYPSVVLIAGGRAKGLDIQPLAIADNVRELIAIGESAEELVRARPDTVVAQDMDEAVERAIAISHPGDVVLLAPGCASFDMFDSYGHRGDVFAAAVRNKVGAS
jgi:UDP-N-acetylmuramoylalanine--D-glutamate ligase